MNGRTYLFLTVFFALVEAADALGFVGFLNFWAFGAFFTAGAFDLF